MTVMVVAPLLEQLRPEQGIDEVEHESRGHEAGERIIEDHGTAPLQSVASDSVAHRKREKGKAEGQHDDVHHLHAPSGRRNGTLSFVHAREYADFDLHQKREDSLIVSYLPTGGYFFEMEA